MLVWVCWVMVEEGVMGVGYDGVYWAFEEKYEFKYVVLKKL